MKKTEIHKRLRLNFPFAPTNDQEILIRKMSEFLEDPSYRKTFILRGYAGTGKTSFIQTLVKSLPQCDFSFSLLATTGRAAKVITDYTNCPASTIHRTIYEITPAKGASIKVKLAINKEPNKIFIVDEASMIASRYNKSLLKGRQTGFFL